KLVFDGADMKTLSGPSRPQSGASQPEGQPPPCPPEKEAVIGPGGVLSVSSRFIRGRLSLPITRFVQADFARVTQINTGGTFAIQPALAVSRAVGACVTRAGLSSELSLASDATRGASEIVIEIAQGVALDDVVMIDDGDRTEFVTLRAIPSAAPASIPVTPRLRFGHKADTAIRRVIFP